MKKAIMSLLATVTVSAASAQTTQNTWINNVKLSGYAMTQYQYSDRADAKSNAFNVRLGRISLDGRAATDWAWKIQLQFNGNTSTLGKSPKLVDAFAEWQKYDFLKVKVGQFKRPFAFENPMNPIDQGFMSYAQNIMKLVYFTDRVGMHSSNGRDIGLQLQGDLLKNNNGRHLLHYQVGVFNGQGINTLDVGQQKDIVGGIWVMPLAGMRIGVFGSEGSYSRKGTWTNDQGNAKTGTRRLPQHRYAISGEYKFEGWTVRSEYIHSTGKAFKTTYNHDTDLKNAEINEKIGDKADGVYALVIAPIIKQKLFAKARYDMYRQSGTWESSKTLYEVGANYVFNKHVQLNAEYARVNDRTLAKHNYNMVDLQLDFRF